ncbi:MAG TPA: HEXXH motif-containing putative peptide modification protein, partial [Kofleriaceae bacterium]|nr:HEXXH motif-containing putative peptide modification protein [Kofleriaceae bacterium]
MSLGGVLFESIDPAGEVALAARLLDYRRRLFDTRIQALDGDRLSAGFADQAGAVLRGVAELCAWSAAHSRLRPRTEGWAASLILHRILFPASADRARGAALRNLCTLLALGALDEEPGERAPITTTTDGAGALVDLHSCDRLPLPYPPHTRIECRYGAGGAVCRPLDGVGPTVRLGRGAAGDVERVPVARARGWDLPVFESLVDLGFDEEFPGGGAAGDGFLPFAASLTGAHDLLAALWPEVVGWVRALAPALVSMGRPGSTSVNRSETYEAGGPIFLAEVDDPFKHAESLVHEIQHHRFRLWAATEPLASVRDEAHRYISPYRPDLRRLVGVHMGVHAFAAVNELRLRARERGLVAPRADRAALRSHFANLFAFRTIVEHDGGGEEARRYAGELARRLLDHHRLLEPLLTPATRAAVDEYFGRHRAQAIEH